MMLSDHKGALALAGCLFTRPGLPGLQTTKRRQGTVPLSPSWYWFSPPGRLQENTGSELQITDKALLKALGYT